MFSERNPNLIEQSKKRKAEENRQKSAEKRARKQFVADALTKFENDAAKDQPQRFKEMSIQTDFSDGTSHF